MKNKAFEMLSIVSLTIALPLALLIFLYRVALLEADTICTFVDKEI